MIYNNYPPYQNSVQGVYQGSYPQQPLQQAYPPQQTYPAQQLPPQPMQIQNGGFVSTRSIEEAQRYPVAPGNAVTFKIEGLPVVCEKSQGFSQLEAPKFEVFDLVKRESNEPLQVIETPQNSYVSHDEILPLKEGIEVLKSEVVKIKEQINEPKRNTTRASKKDGDE